MNMKLIQSVVAAAVFFVAHGLVAGQSVNINEASADELASALSGIGEARAEAIVEFREEHGPFLSVEDLSLVSGIGDATIDRNRELIEVDE